MPGKSTFQDVWLNPILYNDWTKWLRKHNHTTASCIFCKTNFDVSNMGIGAVKHHEKEKKHKERLQAQRMCIPFTQFCRQPVTSTLTSDSGKTSDVGQCLVTVATTQLTDPQIEATSSTNPNSTVQQQNLRSFVIPDQVTRAEVIWALNVIVCHMSIRSGEKCVKLFPYMFEDSMIAKKFCMRKDKLAYIITFGLAPLVDILRRCDFLVIAFDESLNKVAQEGQMDIVVRYWDSEKAEVAMRYLTSTFLGRATAQHLLKAFTEVLEEKQLHFKKIIQLSMDGPNVNLKFLKDFQDYFANRNDPNDPTLMDIGTCSLHIVHGGFKTAHNKCNWNVHLFLRCLYFLFKDFPSRRAQYKDITGSTLFPRKFCAIRWIENAEVAERAIAMLPFLKIYVEGVSKCPPVSENYTKLKGFLNDKLLEAKLGFFQSIALQLEVYLTRFQSNWPLLPFLFGDLCNLQRNLMKRFIKKRVMDEVSNNHLSKVDVTNKDNLAGYESVEIGFPAMNGCKGLGTLDVLTFRKDCRQFLQILCAKLLEKSPLRYKLVQGATCLDPDVMINPNIRDNRINQVLEVFIEHKQISSANADSVKRDYLELCQTSTVKSKLRQFNRKTDRLDHFLEKVLSEESCSEKLTTFCRKIFVLSHGNAAVERGFSVNKECLVENLHKESLIAQRVICDAVQSAGGVNELEISKGMLQAARNASGKRNDALKAKKKVEDEKANRRKRAAEQLSDLKEKKKLLEQNKEVLQAMEQEIDSLKKLSS